MIAKSWLSSCWQWKIGAGVAIAGTLAIGVNSVVLAQIVPDNTLGAESSVVRPNVNIKGIPSDRIDNGAIRGANLFHSFDQFNVGARRGAYFTNPAGIENIFSRVTGANRSEILGRLGVLGNANLFLINPRGIVFGSGASLDVQGSFLATTADAVKLGDTGLFSATQPATSNLLSVSPSAILFNTIAAQSIVNRSRSPGLIRQPNSAGLFPGLQVQPGRTLALIGGNVLLEGGRLTAAGGRIELGSVAGVGQVSLTPNGNRFVLGYDFINDFGNISLLNRAFVDASGEGGGDVQIQGGRLDMAQSSNVWADTLGVENGGEILVRTTETVLSESSLLSSSVGPKGTGTGGDLTIDTSRLLVSDGAQVSAGTFGEGKGGSLQITASESVQLIGTSADGEFSSGLFTQSNGSGDAGDLTIDTHRLLVSDGAQVSASTFGAGKGGSLQITAADAVDVIGKSADGEFSSRLSAQSNGSGDAGNLTIDTRRLLVSDGAEVSASTFGAGKGGNLQITADDAVNVIGESANGEFSSSLLVQSEETASGDAGNLTIDTHRLLVSDGAEVSASTFGAGKGGNLQITADDAVDVIGESANGEFSSGLLVQSEETASGDAGNLTIDTHRLLVRDGAQISVGTFGAGKGGNLQITADDAVELIGRSADGQFPSSLSAQSFGSGDAGNLTIDTHRLLVSDGAQVSASTFGAGKGGSLQITADDAVELIGRSADGQFPSSLSAQSFGSGDAGNLTIDTSRLLVSDGAQVSASTLGEGKGGSLQITAADAVEVIGTTADGEFSSRLLAQSSGSGDAGNLTIDTHRLLVSDGAQVSASTFGAGKGGSLQITADDAVELIGRSADGQFPGGLFTQSNGSGDAGDLTIDTHRLLVRDGAQVSAGTFGAGKGGSLQITADDAVDVIGESADGEFGSGLLVQSEETASGDAGDLTINTHRLLVSDGAEVSASTFGAGKGGNLQITADDAVDVIGESANGEFGSGLFTTSEGSGDAGELRIDTHRLLVRDGAQVSASTLGEGKGGSLQITADDAVDVIGESADGEFGSGLLVQSEETTSGDAGNLTIDTHRLLVSDGAQVSAGTFGAGKGGSLQITADDAVELIGRSADGQFPSGLSVQSFGSGDAGDLMIDTHRLLVSDGAQVLASTLGEGKGGSLQITADDAVELIGRSADGQFPSSLSAQSFGSGDAGNLTIDTHRLLVSDGAQVSASTFGEGKGGSLQITADDAVELIGRSANGEFSSRLLAQSNGSGDAGNLTIDTHRLLVRDGAQVSASTFGAGNSGSLQITADDAVELIGRSADGEFSSGLFTTSEGSGDAGDLTIDTHRLLVRDGAQVSASTFGAGKGGSLQITADDAVDVIGESANGEFSSGLLVQSEETASGDAGNLTIDTHRLLVRDGAEVSASTFGAGKGGSLQITADDAVDVIGESANGEFSSGLLVQSEETASGDAGNLTIDTHRLLVRDGAEVSASTFGAGKGGSLQITADDSVDVIGESANGEFSSGLLVQSEETASGDAGNLTIDTHRLLVRDGAQISAGTFGAGKGGSLQITADDAVDVIGESADGQFPSSLSVQSSGSGDAGELRIDTHRLLVRDGAQVSASTFSAGKGGSLQITADDAVDVIGESANGQFPSGLSTGSSGGGDGGNLTIETERLLVRDGAIISSRSSGEGTAGNINITARDTLRADNGTIETNTSRSTGGGITIKAGDIRLFGNSDIISNVASGADDGGAITLTANSILAFDDSDILAFARDGRGGDITLNTPAFFGENYRPAPRNTDPDPLDNNNRVDINATGAVSGIITIPDVSFIQNSLTELPENQINTDNLLASSCIVRRNQPTRGSFTVTGTGGLPQRPGDPQTSSFPTVDVATLPSDGTASTTNQNRSWQKGDPIVEPQGVYRLANGKLLLSRECS